MERRRRRKEKQSDSILDVSQLKTLKSNIELRNRELDAVEHRSRDAPPYHVTDVGAFSKIRDATFFPKQKHREVVRTGVDATGNCFYNSIFAAAYPHLFYHNTRITKKERAQIFRQFFAREMKKKSTIRAWKKFWRDRKINLKRVPEAEEIRRQLSNPKEWANIYTIMWVIHKMNLNLLVFDFQENMLFCGTHNTAPGRPTVIMAWINRSHFEPIAEFDSRSKRLRTLFSERADSTVLKNLLKLYREQGCPQKSLHKLLPH